MSEENKPEYVFESDTHGYKIKLEISRYDDGEQYIIIDEFDEFNCPPLNGAAFSPDIARKVGLALIKLADEIEKLNAAD